MKKTIKEDLNRNIIKEELIGDNSLIEYIYDKEQDKILLTVRFIDPEKRTIDEHQLTTLSVHDYALNLSNLIRINDEKDTIAIFHKEKEDYILDTSYDLINHNFSLVDYKDIEYNEKFKNQPVDERCVLKKIK